MAIIALVLACVVGIVLVGGAKGVLLCVICTWGIWPLFVGERPGKPRVAAMVVVLATAAIFAWKVGFTLAVLVAAVQMLACSAWKGRQDERAALRALAEWVEWLRG